MDIEAVVLALITGLGIPAVMWLFKDGWSERANRLERLAKIRESATGELAVIVDTEIHTERTRRDGFKWFWPFFSLAAGGVGVGLTLAGVTRAVLPTITVGQASLAGAGVCVLGVALAIRDLVRRGPRIEEPVAKTKLEIQKEIGVLNEQLRTYDAKLDEEIKKAAEAKAAEAAAKTAK